MRQLSRRQAIVGGAALAGAGLAAAWYRRDALAFRTSYWLDGYEDYVASLRGAFARGDIKPAGGLAVLQPPATSVLLADAMNAAGCLRLADVRWRTLPAGSAWGSVAGELRSFEARLNNGFPFIGLAALHAGPSKGTVIYSHGVAATPHMAFAPAWRGYARNGAQQLHQAGFDVVAPFFPNGGNLRSVAQLWLLAGGRGVHLHHCLVSMLSSCVDVAQSAGTRAAGSPGLYGHSMGALLSSHAMALDPRIAALVLTGYANELKISLLSNEVQRLALTGDVYPLAYSPALVEYDLSRCAALVAPRAMLVEYGRNDGMVGSEVSTPQELAAAARANPHLRVQSFEGAHEVDVLRVTSWLADALGSGAARH